LRGEATLHGHEESLIEQSFVIRIHPCLIIGILSPVGRAIEIVRKYCDTVHRETFVEMLFALSHALFISRTTADRQDINHRYFTPAQGSSRITHFIVRRYLPFQGFQKRGDSIDFTLTRCLAVHREDITVSAHSSRE